MGQTNNDGRLKKSVIIRKAKRILRLDYVRKLPEHIGKKLTVKVGFFDEEDCIWPVSIHFKGITNGVGFFWLSSRGDCRIMKSMVSTVEENIEKATNPTKTSSLSAFRLRRQLAWRQHA